VFLLVCIGEMTSMPFNNLKQKLTLLFIFREHLIIVLYECYSTFSKIVHDSNARRKFQWRLEGRIILPLSRSLSKKLMLTSNASKILHEADVMKSASFVGDGCFVWNIQMNIWMRIAFNCFTKSNYHLTLFVYCRIEKVLQDLHLSTKGNWKAFGLSLSQYLN